MEAEPVSHMKSENSGYLFPSFPWSWAWTWGNFKPNLKEEKQLSIWRLRKRAFQETGKASPKALGEVVGVSENSKEVRVPGALRHMLYTLFQGPSKRRRKWEAEKL